MTNYETVVSILQKAKTVNEWNKIRSQLKHNLTNEELNKIDGSGLIVQVLGPDYHVTY